MNNASDPSLQVPSTTSSAWKVLLTLAGILFIVFVVASVNLIRTAISSQPGCVAHERVGTQNAAGYDSAPAAKSAC